MTILLFQDSKYSKAFKENTYNVSLWFILTFTFSLYNAYLVYAIKHISFYYIFATNGW